MARSSSAVTATILLRRRRGQRLVLLHDAGRDDPRRLRAVARAMWHLRRNLEAITGLQDAIGLPLYGQCSAARDQVTRFNARMGMARNQRVRLDLDRHQNTDILVARILSFFAGWC